MFSDTSGMPTRRQQIPRTIRSIFTPAALASYRAEIISGSHREFILARIRAVSPFSALSRSLPIRYRRRSLSHSGARERQFHARGSE